MKRYSISTRKNGIPALYLTSGVFSNQVLFHLHTFSHLQASASCLVRILIKATRLVLTHTVVLLVKDTGPFSELHMMPRPRKPKVNLNASGQRSLYLLV